MNSVMSVPSGWTPITDLMSGHQYFLHKATGMFETDLSQLQKKCRATTPLKNFNGNRKHSTIVIPVTPNNNGLMNNAIIDDVDDDDTSPTASVNLLDNDDDGKENCVMVRKKNYKIHDVDSDDDACETDKSQQVETGFLFTLADQIGKYKK